MDDAIMLVQVLKSKAEDIYLGEDLKNEVKLTLAILHQKNHKAEDLDANINGDKAEKIK